MIDYELSIMRIIDLFFVGNKKDPLGRVLVCIFNLFVQK